MLSACGDGIGQQNEVSTGTGSVTFTLGWPRVSRERRGLKTLAKSPSGDVCIDYAIDTISAYIYTSSDVEVASASWPCSYRKGTVTNVPADPNLHIIIEGRVSEIIKWQGQSLPISVQAGKNTPAGTITMEYCGNDITPPQVESVYPTNGATVSVDEKITIKFSENVVSESVNSSFTLQSDTNQIVSCAVTYDPNNMTATFDPNSSLSYNTVYTATINTNLEDKAGNTMPSNYTWTFTTLDACEESNGGTEACDGDDNDCDGKIDKDFDLDNDPNNCGACENTCRYAHAINLCILGKCIMGDCEDTYYDLNGDPNDGCELSDTLDTDNDGMTDYWEIQKGLNRHNPDDADEDPDLDGLTNLEEYNHGTDPANRDTDGDNHTDGKEVSAGTDPKNPDSYPIIYVAPNAHGNDDGLSWENAYNFLQDALSATNSGDEIWVAEGTYYPDRNKENSDGSGDRNTSFELKNGVAIYGGFLVMKSPLMQGIGRFTKLFLVVI